MAITISPNPAMQDLKVTFQESTLVFPPSKTEKKSLFLSNIDQILNYNVPTLSFFPANKDYPPEVVSERLRLALEKVLVPYDYMAGRLKLNEESGRLEIDCNAAGAGFVVAASEFSLDEMGDLVTSFKCGGFAIGMSVNHILLDGLSAKTFTENLASLAFEDKPMAVIPCLDRRLLAARSPPLVAFQHPEFYKPDLPISGPPVFDCKKEELEFRVFKLSPTDINFLKDKAKPADQTNSTATKISSFNVVAALIWLCKALSCEREYNKDRISTLLNVIDIRSRLNPPLPSSYCGNAVLVAYSSAKCEDIEKWPFSDLVKMVSEAPNRVSDEYARSVIDWLEIKKGCLVENTWKDICWVFPTVDGVNALVSLPAQEMKRFESQFHNLFACDSCIFNHTDPTAQISKTIMVTGS
ncbi:hypothetical protein DH2020_041657 [Rehmannia glutinosa]|uniref:Uncharacterized protein n=1 Tax=Rehmannia glutinosa TaxID=99300 RepID=A0ABR0UQY2_REHGL